MLRRFRDTIDPKTHNLLRAISATNTSNLCIQAEKLPVPSAEFELGSSINNSRVSVSECTSNQSSEVSESVQSQENLLSDRAIHSKAEEVVNSFVKKETFIRLVTQFLASPLARELGKRYDVWNSLLHSERAYFRNLVLLYEVYYLQLKKAVIVLPNRFSGYHILSIFQNLEELKTLTKKLCKKLEKCQKSWPQSIIQIGCMFSSVMGELKLIYGTYIKGFSKAFKQLVKANNLPEFSNFLRKNKEFSTSEGMVASLDSLLVLPIYHLERYIYFFKKMQFMTQRDHPDYGELIKVRQELEALSLELKPFQEGALKLYKSYRLNSMTSSRKSKSGMLSTEDLELKQAPIREGPILLITKKKAIRLNLLLFSDVLILSVVSKLRGNEVDQTIPLHRAQVCHHRPRKHQPMTCIYEFSQDSYSSSEQLSHLFKLEQDGECFIFGAQTDAEKRSWVEDLTAQINSIKKRRPIRTTARSVLAPSRKSSQRHDLNTQRENGDFKYFSGCWTEHYCEEFLKGIVLCHGELSFLENLINSLPLLPIKISPQSKCLFAYQGPSDNQREFYLHMPLLSGMVTSIDPFIRKTSNQSYLPCQCGVVIWNHFTLVCIADGLTCNAASRQACECAVKAVVSEFRALNLVSNELRRTVAGILKCYSLAHKRILENQKIIWNAGTTTLLVCVTVEVEPCEASEFCKWCCISVSIGNGRVYYWNRQEGRVQEVTRHSEYADPGGRIGPYIYNGCPDLRNFEVSYKFCSAGDVIFLCSRNLYEKFDPEYLGVMPNEVRALKSSGTGDADQLPDKWKDLDANTSFSLRKLYEIHALEKKINGLEIVSPSQIVAALMGHYIKTHYLKVDRSASFEPHTTTGFKDFEYAACIVYAIGPPANTVT